MRLTSKIEKAASKDQSRPVLAQPWLNVEKSRIEATDSYIAVVVPTEIDDGDLSGPIPLDAISAARKRSEVIECGQAARVPGYAAFDRPSLGYTWPDIDALTPTGEPAFTIRVDPKLLARAAEALNADNLQLDFYAAEKTFVARGDSRGGYAIVMPVAMKGGVLDPMIVAPAELKAA